MTREAVPAQHDADSHDLIRVQGARENNLKDVSVELPKRRLTVFTGVSGSGKTSLVFGTIAAESQRLINETYSTFVQGFMPTLARPEVDVLDGLTTAILVDQQRMGGTRARRSARRPTPTRCSASSSAGSASPTSARPARSPSTSRPSRPAAGSRSARRQDGDQGGELQPHRRHVPALRGPGRGHGHRPAALYDDTKSLNEGALTIPGYSMDGWYGRIFRGCGFFDPDKPIGKFKKKQLNDLLYKEPTKIRVEGINLTYEGLIPRCSGASWPRTSTR